MHLVIKNLSPEDFKKYNKRGITCICKWSEKYKKETEGGGRPLYSSVIQSTN